MESKQSNYMFIQNYLCTRHTYELFFCIRIWCSTCKSNINKSQTIKKNVYFEKIDAPELHDETRIPTIKSNTYEITKTFYKQRVKTIDIIQYLGKTT